jgi:hypothetical protein
MTSCNGTCVDTQMDVHNCGRCGHDCLYGACSAGGCQPWTVVPNGDVAALDADGTYVVWADSGQGVHQVKPAGGAIVTLSQFERQGLGDGPVLKNGTVAFVDQSRNIMTLPEGQASATATANVPNPYTNPVHLALNPSATTAFLIGQENAAPYPAFLLQCPLSNQPCTALGSSSIGNLSGPGDGQGQLLVNTSYAFWAYAGSFSSITSLNRYTFATNTTTTVNTTVLAPMAIDATNIYWMGTPYYTIYSLPQSFSSGMMPQSLANAATEIDSLSSDGTNVYFGAGSGTATGTLSYVPVGGGSAKLMYTSPKSPSSESPVVAAGGAVYWADYDVVGGTANIMGIATP